METKADVDEELLSTNHVSTKQNLDISEVTGGDGLWQRRIFLIICFLQMPCAFNIFSMSFLAPNIDHWCARPPEARNLSVKQWRTLAVPPYDEQCSRYEHINISHLLQNSTDISEQASIRCESWEYDTTLYHSTILSQFDLVCNRKWLVSLSKSIYIAGMSVSLILFGHLSDKIGRKPVIIISGLLSIISSVTCAVSNTFLTFLTARFFIALGVNVFISAPYVLLMEIVSPKHRHIYGIGVQLGWSSACIALPFIAWLIRDSFWIQMAITSPCLMLLAIRWIPESPRWLLSHGKIEEAEAILLTAAKVNGVRHSDEHKEVLREIMNKGAEVYVSGSSKGNVLDLFKTPGLWQITSNLYFDWLVIAFVYYGLSINTNELAGDPFVNFALNGIAELVGIPLNIVAVGYLGRKKTLVASMIISGVACFASYLFPSDLWWLITAITIIGKLSISVAFQIIFLFSNELFPTVVRNIGMGSASLCARFGSITAPFMRELGDATHPVFPQIIFGTLSMASAFLVSLLPETKNCSVPDTLQEAAHLSRKKNHTLQKEIKRKCIKIKLTECETNNEQTTTNLLV